MTLASTEPQDPPTSPPAPTRKRRWLLALGLCVPLLVASCVAWRTLRAPLAERTFAEHSGLRLDLARPDALIESTSLSALPKDLLTIPMLRDTLTEDFVFYYEGNADRLGITGALRRIAYEHELSWKDSLINELLDQPAEVALWRGSDGKLGHLLVSIERGALSKLLQPLAEVAASDSQLTQVGELHIAGDAAPVYRLRYNFDRSILLVAHDDRLLVLSTAQMLMESNEPDSALGQPETEQLEALLSAGSPYAERFGLGKRRVDHRITVSADYLALGYGQFIPQLAGLRLEMDGDQWRGFLALNPGGADDLTFAPLWQAMPMGASVCAAVPVAREALQPLLERLTEQASLAPELAAQLGGPVALCWYGKSRLHTPLLVTRLSGAGNPAATTQLGEVFGAMVGAYEELTDDGRFPVDFADAGGAQTWKRVVGSSFGLHPAAELPNNELLSQTAWFKVALARRDDVLLFSLDDALVDQALATLDQHFPPLAEQLPRTGAVPIYLAADSLATLLETESLQSLPADMEPLFRNAAQAHLLPKLHALGQYQRYALTLPADAKATKPWTWLPLQWNAL